MYNALDDLFPRLAAGGLLDRLMNPESSKTLEDVNLVNYVRKYQKLHPKIKAARKVSRTDIFEVLFGPDEEAKQSRMSYTVNVTAVTMEKCISLKRTPGSVC
jgi:phosphoglycolate phosphatase